MYFAQADYFSKVSCSKVLIFGQLFLAYLDVQKTVAFHTDGNRKPCTTWLPLASTLEHADRGEDISLGGRDPLRRDGGGGRLHRRER